MPPADLTAPDSIYYSVESLPGRIAVIHLNPDTTPAYMPYIMYPPGYVSPQPEPSWWSLHGSAVLLALFAAFVLAVLIRERRKSVEEPTHG